MQKKQRHRTYITPQSTYCSCSGIVRQTKPEYSLCSSHSLWSWNLAWSCTSVVSWSPLHKQWQHWRSKSSWGWQLQQNNN